MSKHDRNYNVLLMVVGFLLFLGMGEMIAMRFNPTMSPEIKWVFTITAFIEGCYLAATTVTLVVRLAMPRYRKPITMAMNIIWLTLFPFGTALGIYGLWKVDKQMELPGFPVETHQA